MNYNDDQWFLFSILQFESVMQVTVNKINWQNVFGLIIYPVFLVLMMIFYIKNIGFNTSCLLFILLGHYVTNISVGVGLHRLWSHSAFKTNKFVEFILMLLTAGAIQGPVIAWASDHFKHHSFTDEDQDPHSPLKFKNRFKGFMWSHIGWMLYKDFSLKNFDRVTMKKLGANKLLMFQLKNYWKLVYFMHLVPPFLLGYCFNEQSIIGGLSGVLFIGIGRAFQQHMTFCINSVCHFFGRTPYADTTAKDVWWLGPLMLGENWHNFHHAFPCDYRNGARWYHLDVHKWVIYLMYKVGLAWDLNITSEDRISAKISERNKDLTENTKAEWMRVEDKCYQLLNKIKSITTSSIQNSIMDGISEIEKHSENIKTIFNDKISDAFNQVITQVDSILLKSRVFIESPEKSTMKIMQNTTKELKNLEEKICFYIAKIESKGFA